MAIYALGDLHLSLGTEKPMDIFWGWQDYVERLELNWNRIVAPEDTVVLCGDTSWAMKLSECDADFSWINRLPGQKIILKGNHDYWWNTVNKMNNYCVEKGFFTLHFLHNNSYCCEGVSICGSRSWFFGLEDVHDEKVHNREILRLKASLEAAQTDERIVFLHYPPIYQGQVAQDVIALLKQFEVKRCYYGHLHGKSNLFAFNGEYEGILFRLISADSLSFCPLHVK